MLFEKTPQSNNGIAMPSDFVKFEEYYLIDFIDIKRFES